MEQIEPNNPAARLHRIISRAKEFTYGPANKGEAGNLWAGVFDLPPSTLPVSGPVLQEVISRLLQLDKLITETEESLRRIEGLPEKYFQPFERIRKIPERSLISLSSDIREIIRNVTPVDMTVLDFCSDKLEEQHAEIVVSDDELQALLEDVNQLFDEVKTAKVDPSLQTFILDGLESIRRGIYEFRIRGSERLKETIGEIVGSLYVNHKVVEAAGEDDSLEKFNKLFNRLSAMVTFANTSVKLLTAFAAPLLPG
ncbi:MAG TPA: hypothetical protein VF435_17720 [Pyrinomonadaceae bacterium]